MPSQSYIDIAGLWDVTDSIRLRLGVNNVMDEDPPLAPFGSGNTIPEIYDALGRYWFAGMTFRL